MELTRKYFISLVVLLGLFFFLIAMLAISFIFVSKGDAVGGLIFVFVRYHIQLMVLLGLIGVGVGISSYLSFRSQKRDVEASNQSASKVLLSFFDATEKQIIEKLVTGPTTQAEISRMKKIGKVKAFRTLQRLEAKGLIVLEEHGKTKKIELKEEILKLFS